MNSCIPLCKRNTRCSVLTIEGKHLQSALGGWGEYFFVANPSCISVFRYVGDHGCKLIGKVFFRSTESGEKCSILRSNQELFDFQADFLCQDPKISVDIEVTICKNNLVSFYHLYRGTLFACSASGHIAVVFLEQDNVKGCILPFAFPCKISKWVANVADCCIIGFSNSCIALVKCNGCLSRIYTCNDFEDGFRLHTSGITFCRPSLNEDCYVLALICNGCQELFELNIKLEGKLDVQRAYQCEAVPIECSPIEVLFLHSVPFMNCTVVIGLYEISVNCEVCNISLPSISLFSSSCVPYSCGFRCCSDDEVLWTCFCVCRLDGVFELYLISLDPVKCEVNCKKELSEVLPVGTVSMCMCKNQQLLFLLHMSGSSRIVEWKKCGVLREISLEKITDDEVVIADLALVGGNEYGMCYLSNSGKCTLVTDKRNTIVAKVQYPKRVSALLVLESRQSLLCLLGSSCGSIMFFKDNIFLAEDFCAHLEGVTKIMAFENFFLFGSLFISISHCGRTFSLHGSKCEKLCVSSHGSLITGYDVEASKGLLFLYSNDEVSAWRIPDGRMECTVPYLSASRLCKIRHFSLDGGLRVVHQKFCNEAQFFFAFSVDYLIESLRETGTASREFNVALTLALGSCASCMNKYPLNDKFMHVIDQSGLCVLPTMSLESYLNAIQMEAALFEYSSQKHHSIQACESIAALVTGLASKLSFAVPEHGLLIYYEKFHHWACFPLTLFRVYFAFMVNIVSRIDIVERFAQVLGKSFSQREDEIVDFIGFSLTVGRFRGFISAALLVWKSTFEGSQEVEKLSELLATHAKQIIETLEKASLLEVDNLLRSLASLSEAFWIEKDEMERRRWFCTLFELLSMSSTSHFTKQLCYVILERIASGDVYHFYSHCLPWIYNEKPSWRKPLLELMKTLMEKYCLESYSAPYPLFKLLSHLYDAKISKAERQEYAEFSLEVMMQAASFLPNVSFHRQSQTLVVGLRDGCAHVRHLSSNTTDSFVAHQDAILCISCNEFAVNCQEIATISEKMHHIKLWRTKPNSNNFLVDFLFSGPANSRFTRFKTILLHPPDPEVTALFSQFTNLQSCKEGSLFIHPCPFYLRCELKWINYSTLQLSTPWYGTRQFSL